MGIVLAIPDGTYEIIQDDYSDLANLIRERLGEDVGQLISGMTNELSYAEEELECALQEIKDISEELESTTKELEELDYKYETLLDEGYERVPADDKLDKVAVLLKDLLDYIGTAKRIDRKSLTSKVNGALTLTRQEFSHPLRW